MIMLEQEAVIAVPVGASILLSAGTYLFDFGSNIAVVWEFGTYSTSTISQLQQKGICAGNSYCSFLKSKVNLYFLFMLAVLVISHTLNAVLFKSKFKHEDAPCRAAYFLPLIHLWRLADLLWRTLSFKGVQDLRSGDMNALYNILGSSLEGAPFLSLQFCAYWGLHLVSERSNLRLFIVSTTASVLFVAYNGGTAVQSSTDNAKTLNEKLKVAVAAGLFTMFATINRSLTYTYFVVYLREHLLRTMPEGSWAKFHISETMPILFGAWSLISYWLFYWLLQFPKAFFQRLCDPKRCLASFAFAYMSIILGPLYPMVSEAKDRGQVGRHIFHARLLIVVLLNVSQDMTVVFVFFALKTLPNGYLEVSLVVAVGYLVSIGWYIRTDMAISRRSRFREHDSEDVENPSVDLDDCQVTIPPVVVKVQSVAAGT